MLHRLYVKNLALIEEEEILFERGLNILTGETGAGKSVLLGAVLLALGVKADKNLIRSGAEYALIELTFTADTQEQEKILSDMDLQPDEDGQILVKRRIYPGRNICYACGESVTLRQLKTISDLLLEVHGQRENGALLESVRQREALDIYMGDPGKKLLKRMQECCSQLRELQSAWETDDLDESQRRREEELLRYEIGEIEDAALIPGEDARLEERFRILGNAGKIRRAVAEAEGLLVQDNGAADLVTRAQQELRTVKDLDPALSDIWEISGQIDMLLSDAGRALSDYAADLTFDEEELRGIEERLQTIYRIKEKYCAAAPYPANVPIEDILALLEEKKERLTALSDYEASRASLRERLTAAEETAKKTAEELTQLRREKAEVLSGKLEEILHKLSFNHVEFAIHVLPEEKITPAGWDKVEFMVSLNEGEAPRPLKQIASGGELSRIMLALRTVLAGRQDVRTFIFDEIDSGISGQTAWKIAVHLHRLSAEGQVICITHLPQIAAMADAHFRIDKEESAGRTRTHVARIRGEESLEELARLLGGGEANKEALANAAALLREAKTAQEEQRNISST